MTRSAGGVRHHAYRLQVGYAGTAVGQRLTALLRLGYFVAVAQPTPAAPRLPPGVGAHEPVETDQV
ncbi:MAG: hypothetical protein IAE79_09510 [Anaerolinea sp.]|nr:hypothetical protein [Anaerolinea sp.]